VEVGQTTYPVSNGRVEREGREGSEKKGREGGNATGEEDQPKDPYPRRVGSIGIFVHGLPEFLIASLLIGPVCLLSQGRFECITHSIKRHYKTDQAKCSNTMRTERMFGDDRFEGDQRIALSLIVDGCHAELILLSLFQPGDVTLGGSAELADRRPPARLLVFFLHHVVTDRLAAIVLRNNAGKKNDGAFIIIVYYARKQPRYEQYIYTVTHIQITKTKVLDHQV